MATGALSSCSNSKKLFGRGAGGPHQAPLLLLMGWGVEPPFVFAAETKDGSTPLAMTF